jgi:hypothetical protein
MHLPLAIGHTADPGPCSRLLKLPPPVKEIDAPLRKVGEPGLARDKEPPCKTNIMSASTFKLPHVASDSTLTVRAGLKDC